MQTNQIERQLRDALDNNRLEIIPAELGLGEWWNIVGETVNGQSIVLEPCRILEEGGIALRGETTAFGLGTTELYIHFADTDAGLCVKTNLQVARGYDLSLPALSWLAVKNITVHMDVTGSQGSSWVSAQAQIGELRLPLKLVLPTYDDSWIFSISCQADPISLELIESMLGLELDFLPAGLKDALTSIALQDLRINFNSSTAAVTWIDLTMQLKVNDNWQPVPKWLQLDDLTLRVAASPTAKGRRPDISAVIMARASLGTEIELKAWLTLGDGGWRIRLGANRIPIPDIVAISDLIGQDLQSLLPAALANMDSLELCDLTADYDLVSMQLKHARFKLQVNSNKPIELLPGINLRMPTVFVAAQIKDKLYIDLSIRSKFRIGNIEGKLSGSIKNRAYILEGSLSNIHLSKLVKEMVASHGSLLTLPDELPELTFEKISVAFSTADHSFTLHGECNAAVNFVGGGGLSLSYSSFTLGRTMVNGKPNYPFSIQLKAEKQIPTKPWPEGIELKSLDLKISHQGGKWEWNGSLMADLFEAKDVNFSANYQVDNQESILSLKMVDANVDLLQFTEIDAALCIEDNLTISISRTKNSTENNGNTHFGLEAGAHLRVKDKLDIVGQLGLGDETGIILCIDAPGKPLMLQAPIGFDAPCIALSGGSIGIVPTASSDSASPSWQLLGSVSVQFTSFPPRIQQALPNEAVTATFSIGQAGFSIKVSELLADRAIPLPPLPMSGKQLQPLSVNAKDLAVTFNVDGDFYFSFKPELMLPDDLNATLFGCKGKDGEGTEREILVTGKPIRSELKLGLINNALGASFSLIDSPFQTFELEEDGKIWPCDLGAVGLVRIDVPDFAFGSNGFAVSGGFSEDQERPLCLPLTPIKNALAKKFPELTALIPDKLKLLKKPKLLSGDKLDVVAFTQFLENNFGDRLPQGKIPEALVNALQRIADAATGLPDRLKEYLEADLPAGLHFAIQGDPSGSVTADIRTDSPPTDGTAPLTSAQSLDPTEGGRPIMLLFPSATQLTGLRLSNFQFGPIFGGALIMLRCNLELDVFDPITLATNLMASQSETLKSWLPECTNAHTTYQAHDLIMFIVYQGGIPIPIPIFYEKLGFDIAAVAGIELKASVSFNPLTHNNLMDIFATVSNLYNFITDKEYELDPKMGVQLDASIGETYLKLPAFLGSAVVGPKGEPLLDVDFSAIFANFLNGLKFFRLKDLVQGIPLEYRCGSINPKFGPIELKASWAATTRDEFMTGLAWSQAKTQQTNALVGLPAAEREKVLTVLDCVTEDVGKGCVLLIAGEQKFGQLLTLGGRFCMVTAGRNGFATGVQLYTDLLNHSLAVKISGLVAFDLTKELGEGTAGFHGQGRLELNGQATVDIGVDFSDTKIGFSVMLDLFPQLAAITISGDTTVAITKDGLNATGRSHFSLFGKCSVEETFQLTPESFSLSAKANLPADVKLNLTITALTLASEGHATIKLTGGLENLSPNVVAETAQQSYLELNNVFKRQTDWADREFKRINNMRWYWGKKVDLAKFKAYGAIYRILGKSVTGSVSGLTKFFEAALNLLPTRVAQAVRHLRNQPDLIEDLKIKVAGQMSDALNGQASIIVSGRFANTPFETSLLANPAAPDVFKQISTAIAKQVL